MNTKQAIGTASEDSRVRHYIYYTDEKIED